MSITTVTEFRTFDTLGAFTALSDPIIQQHLDIWEERLFGAIVGRGYAEPTTLNESAKNAVFVNVRVALFGVRGINPSDPGHVFAVDEAKRAEDWVRREIAAGNSNLIGTGAPTRATTGLAGGYSSDEDESRGW